MAEYAKVQDGKILTRITTEDALKIQKLEASGYLLISKTAPAEINTLTEKSVEQIKIEGDKISVTYAVEALDTKIAESNLIEDRVMKMIEAENTARREKAIAELKAEGKIA